MTRKSETPVKGVLMSRLVLRAQSFSEECHRMQFSVVS